MCINLLGGLLWISKNSQSYKWGATLDLVNIEIQGLRATLDWEGGYFGGGLLWIDPHWQSKQYHQKFQVKDFNFALKKETVVWKPQNSNILNQPVHPHSFAESVFWFPSRNNIANRKTKHPGRQVSWYSKFSGKHFCCFDHLSNRVQKQMIPHLKVLI